MLLHIQVLEGIPESRVFKPPNPWTMGLLNAMRELYDVPEIKLNLRFEVEVSCEHEPRCALLVWCLVIKLWMHSAFRS